MAITDPSAPADMKQPVYVGDLPPEVVFAALYDVAWSPGMGSLDPNHSADGLELSESRALLDAVNGDVDVDYFRGRALKFVMRDGWVAAAAYDLVNGNGQLLVQAIVDELRASVEPRISRDSELDDALSVLVSSAARKACGDLDAALLWRNTALHAPRPQGRVIMRVVMAGQMLPEDQRGAFNPRSAAIALMPLNHYAVGLWAVVQSQIEVQGAEPLAELEATIELYRTIGSEAGRDRDDVTTLEQRLIDAAAEQLAVGKSWWDVPAAWEDVLVEHAVGQLARGSARPDLGTDLGVDRP